MAYPAVKKKMLTSATNRNFLLKPAAPIRRSKGIVAPRIATKYATDTSLCLRGFTLLELLIVLSIIAIAAALIIPGINSLGSSTLQAEVQRGVATLNYARRSAIVKSSPQVATFLTLNPDSSEQQQYLPALTASADTALWQSDSINLLFQVDQNQPQQVTELARFTFFPQGGSTGGILTLHLDNLHASILVDPITGRVTSRLFNDEQFVQGETP